MKIQEIFELVPSYSYLRCIAGEQMLSNEIGRALFYYGANIDEVRPGDLLMIRETFWNTYEYSDFISPLQDKPISAILLHHRCCSGDFLKYYMSRLEQMRYPVVVYDCPNSEILLLDLQMAMGGPEKYALHILRHFETALRQESSGQISAYYYIKYLERVLNTKTVFLPMTGSVEAWDGSGDQRFITWAREKMACWAQRESRVMLYEGQPYTFVPVRDTVQMLGCLVLHCDYEAMPYFRAAAEVILQSMLPRFTISNLREDRQNVPLLTDRHALFEALLSGTLKEENAVKRMADAIGVGYDVPRVAVILDCVEKNENCRCDVKHQFGRFLQDNKSLLFDMATEINEEFYILGIRSNSRVYEELKESVDELMTAFALRIGHPIKAAVSSVAANLSELARVRTEAEVTMRFGRMFEPEANLYYYDNYIVYHLLSRATGNRVVIKLYDDIIRRITIYDAEHKTALVETLRVLAMSDFNMQQAAEKLFIHRNTLYKRIEKLSELLDMDFHSTGNYLIFQIAVRLQQLLS